MHEFTLRFLDPELEARYQVEEGEAGLAGYRLITGATTILWAIAAVVLPLGMEMSSSLGLTVGGLMATAGLVCLVASRRAPTMNAQHTLASALTSANGLVILALFEAAGAIEGYAVGAIMLLFLFGFVSRTRFVHAAVRTFIIALGLAFAVVVYDGERSLLVDSFIFSAASIGSLLGLRLIERNRRRVWHQRLVIEEQTAVIEAEQAQSERLLLNVLPASISRRLKNGESPIADKFPSVSVLFADLVGFTPLSSTLTAGEVISLLSRLFSHFDDLVIERGLEKIKTIGDAYMAAGGLPEPLAGHADLVVDLALAMIDATSPTGPFPDLTIRIGVHSGAAAGGVIGARRFAYDVWGDTVNVAARLEQTGMAGRVHVSEATRQQLQGLFRFEARGPTELKGKGETETYFVVDHSNRSPRENEIKV